jgi:hypothetical protein
MGSLLQDYQYLPLKDDEIRLAYLLPEQAGSELQCIIKHVKISEAPLFECLSYVWGEEEKGGAKHWIYCDAKQFSVRRNLLTALFCIRTDKVRPLWIDQICIDQNNLLERNAQVLRMAEIYRNAQQVVLFPGTPCTELGDALLFMLTFSSAFGKKWYFHEGDFRKAWGSLTSAELHRKYGIPLPDDSDWKAVRFFLDQPCFRRTWIVQEVALAKKLRLLFSPGMELDWDDERTLSFGAFFKVVCDRNHSVTERYGVYIGREMVFARAMVLTRGMSQLIPDHPSLSLLSLLIMTRRFEVTDPRDKIYGLLSVASDLDKLKIEPNYSNSVKDVYIDVTHRLINTMGSLKVLGFVETLKHDEGLPSWVPDWRSQRMELFGDEVINAKQHYNATLGSKIQLRDLGDKHKLGLRGMLIDVVKRVTSGPLPDDAESHGYLMGHGLWWMRARTAIGPVYKHTGEKLAVALGRTRFADDKSNIPGEAADKDDIAKVREGENGSAQFRSYSNVVLNQTLYRCLITTRDRYLGLAPLTVDEGDMIFLLRGADVPFILRKVTEDEFQLVGQCYVHGIMNGEFLKQEQRDSDDEESDKRIWRDITLI